MTDQPGRRGLPPEPEYDAIAEIAQRNSTAQASGAVSAPTARRGLEDPRFAAAEPAEGTAPARRGAIEASRPARHSAVQEATTNRGRPASWIIILGTALVLALVIGIAYAIIKPRTDGAAPAPTPSPTSTSPSSAGPSSAGPSQTAKPGLPTGSGAAPSTQTEEPVAPPTVDSNAPAATASTTSPLDLGDTIYPQYPGWELYFDEPVQDGRRLIRLRDPSTDTRVQAVALEAVAGTMQQACTDLMRDHRSSYNKVAETLPVNIPVPASGDGVSCSFEGTRLESAVPTKVTFVLLRRSSDGHVLVLRDSMPTSVPADSRVTTDLEAAFCSAATTFGVPPTQCPATPAQADG